MRPPARRSIGASGPGATTASEVFCSLAIAVNMLQFAHVSFTPQETGPPPGSFDWFAAKLDGTLVARLRERAEAQGKTVDEALDGLLREALGLPPGQEAPAQDAPGG